MSSCVYVSVSLHVRLVHVCVFHATLHCVISQCLHVSFQAGREAAGAGCGGL